MTYFNCHCAEIEVIYLTSRIYPVEVIEAFESWGIPLVSNFLLYSEAIDSFGVVLEGELRQILKTYDEYAPEAIESFGVVLEGDIRQILLTYEEYPPEAVESFGIALGGSIDQILLTYEEYPPEAIESYGILIAGTLI